MQYVCSTCDNAIEHISTARAEAIGAFWAKAIARSQEKGDLKSFVLVEDLYDISKKMKEENK